VAAAVFSFGLVLAVLADAQQISLRCDPAQTTARFTLGGLHSVHGSFQLKRCQIPFDPVSGKIGGEVVFDATSGQTANGSRDRKMHKEVLESERDPEITFRPDRVEGKVAVEGVSTVRVHGLFGIHGAEHEIMVPVEVTLNGDRWTASSQFPVPYVKWGMKNPSVLFLRVGDSVNVEFHGAGTTSPGPQPAD